MGMLLFLTNTTIWLYVTWRFACRLPGRKAIGFGLALVLLPLAEYYLIAGAVFGSMASIELPRRAMIILAWAFGAFLLLAMLVLLRDLAGLLVLACRRRAGRAMLRSRRLNVVLGVLAMGMSVFGVWQAIKIPAVKTLEVSIPDLPEAFDGYRIVQLSDLHASRLLPASWIASVVARSNRLHPDLIVVTGDLQDGTPKERAAAVRPMRELHARDGVLAVPGNHEYYTDYPGWMKAFRRLGLHMLVNTHVLIHRHDRTMAVAGISDRTARSFGQTPPDLKAALAGLPANVPVVLLSHRPDNADASSRAGVDLQLSGHTHGGQILGPHLLTQWANRGYVSGLYRVGTMSLYVSNGTGIWNGLAIRIGRPSEITQIVLRSAGK